ncbi:PAS domain-containing sensor histidine kinase [Solirubrobacter pauli]|nr:PAS domain S-box protein [Solirubrobacter pauli]
MTDLPLAEALMASLADAVYFVDAAGEVSFVNPAALTVLGYDDELELLGVDSHSTIHSHHRDGSPFPADECPLLRPRTTGETVRVELDWFIRRDGSFVPVSYVSSPMATPDGRGAVVVFRDVSERLAAEEVSLSRARIIQAADEERRRIGRDLHDGAQQRLVSLLISVEQARRDPAHAPDALARAAAEARQAIQDLRDLVNGVHPLVLTDRGVAVALEELTASAPIAVHLDVTEERFAPAVEAAAYFTVAEALTNVFKHAGATHAEVTVRRDGDTLTIEVDDDGRGGADPAKGSGLRGLQDRLAVLHGSLEVADRRVRGVVPLAGGA